MNTPISTSSAPINNNGQLSEFEETGSLRPARGVIFFGAADGVEPGPGSNIFSHFLGDLLESSVSPGPIPNIGAGVEVVGISIEEDEKRAKADAKEVPVKPVNGIGNLTGEMW